MIFSCNKYFLILPQGGLNLLSNYTKGYIRNTSRETKAYWDLGYLGIISSI